MTRHRQKRAPRAERFWSKVQKVDGDGRDRGLHVLIALKKFRFASDFLALFDEFAAYISSKSYKPGAAKP